MSASHKPDCTVATAPVLYMALELSSGTWKLAFTVGLGQKPRLKTVTARSTVGLLFEIKAAKKRFGLPEDALFSVVMRRVATVSGCIASSWPMGSRTKSSTPPASRSTAAREGPSPTALTQ